MTWEYIAGFFDGEGTVGMRSRNRTRIEMCQSKKQGDVLYQIQEFLRINGIQSTIVQAEGANSPILRLQMYHSNNIYKFLVKVCPHLIVKKDKAEDAREGALRIIDKRNDSRDVLNSAVNARLSGMKTREVWIRFRKGSKEVKAEIDKHATIQRN